MGSATTARLDRLLANLGYGSRREIAALVREGQVRLNGDAVMDAGQKVALVPDLPERLTICGERLDPLAGLVLMMNKPLGVTCSHKDTGPLVYDLLPARWRLRKPAISSIGRLDKDTSGLLLLTDDGGLLHRAISPKQMIFKRYKVTLARPLRGDEAGTLEAGGLILNGETKPLLPARLDVADTEAGERPVVYIHVQEGRYHQVRRMFAALGNHVEALHRDRFGGLELPADLEPAAWRVLDASDIANIFEGSQAV